MCREKTRRHRKQNSIFVFKDRLFLISLVVIEISKRKKSSGWSIRQFSKKIYCNCQKVNKPDKPKFKCLFEVDELGHFLESDQSD